MWADASLPDTFPAPAERARESAGVPWRSAVWTPDTLGRLARSLARDGATALAAVEPERRLDAWGRAIRELGDPSSQIRRALRAPLAHHSGLSPAGLDAALESVLGGVRRRAAQQVFDAARGAGEGAARRGLAVVVLASNIPGLAVQPLLPALALGRPVLIKSPSAEPLFAPALIDLLCRHAPVLRPALAAVTWPGGDAELEANLWDAAERVVAYGGGAAMADLEGRLGDKLVPFGPKLSLAAIGAGIDPRDLADGLARDIALFDQRGCLSIQAVYTAGDAPALAHALADALSRLARRWPLGDADPAAAAQVRQLRGTAAMRGLVQPPLDLRAGTVVVEPAPALHPSPGLRTVRVHPVPDLATLPTLLGPWSGRLQGVALAGTDARALEPALAALGCSRFAPPGQLQSPDATWHNGGVSPLVALG